MPREINATSLKVALPFKAGSLPKIDPERPVFDIVLGSAKIRVMITAKCARKLATHPGGAVLQGKLTMKEGQLAMEEAGCQFFDPKPAEVALDRPGAPQGPDQVQTVEQAPAEGTSDRPGPLAKRIEAVKIT